MRDILIITSYFPPETGAASNRIFHLAEGLGKNNFRVSVITPLPNYPKGKVFKAYKGRFKATSIENNIIIHRLWIYASISKNTILRLISMFSYSFSLFWFFLWNKIPKTVIVQSPPLLVAFTSILFLRSKKRKLILNVSDLWPIAGLELGALKKGISYSLLEKIERFNYSCTDLILGQSEEILTHINSLFPNKKTFLYRNYPDFNPSGLIEKNNTNKKIKLVYAGLLGFAQGIYNLSLNLDYKNVQFHIYGAGAEKSKIETLASDDSKDIVYHGEISRNLLHKELLKYDITIIPLLKRIYGSVPSKIFEYAKLGLPIIYFGGGEGENLIEKHQLGWVSEAGNYKNLNALISSIRLSELDVDFRKKIRQTAIENFDFNLQFEQLVEKI